MKKMYIVCFIFIACIASIAYVVSFQYGYEMSNEDQIFLETEVENWMRPVNMEEEDTITRRTVYVIETYHITENTMEEQELAAPLELLGFNRQKLCEYLQSYMQNLPENEREEGLLSFELKEFHEDRVVLRKTYKNPNPNYLYYFDVQLGHIVVCNAQDGSLYAYTEIKFQNLPPELQSEVLAGKYISTVEELYEFLEAYSS